MIAEDRRRLVWFIDSGLARRVGCDTGLVKMNFLGRLALNNPVRAFAQARYVIPRFERLGCRLDGCRVLELGCGRGVGTALLLEVLGAGSVDAIDLDPLMVRRARTRLKDRAAVGVGDMTRLDADDASYDAVVDFGAMHLEPDWRGALQEVARVLRPGGQFLFEQISRGPYRALAPLATGKRIPGALTAPALLDEITLVGLEIQAVARPRLWSATAAVGDLLGVARKNPGPEHAHIGARTIAGDSSTVV